MVPSEAFEAAIYCEGLTRHYEEVRAVQDLHLSVPYGSIFGFIGRNGAGKTTTIRMLTGLAHPTSGRAWVAGVETTGVDSLARRKFGYLPQSPAFYNWMRAGEYLDYVAQIFGIPKPERNKRIAEVIELVGLKEAARRRIGGFSGGMNQRLGIAQALIHQPPVLFLDEPTSALDPAGRYEVLKLIAALRGKVTVFLSSHILGDIERICDTIGIIRQGQLLMVTTQEALLTQYAVNAVELEFDHSLLPVPENFLAALKSKSWVGGITQNENILRISVLDADEAKRNLLTMVASSGLQLDRYEWVKPTLEEIFLKISA